MDALLKQLIELQAIDTELRRIEGELVALPKELSTRDGEMKRAKEAVAANKDAIKKAQAEAKSHENEIKAREEKIEKFEGEANRVRDNAQLFAIQHQIKTLREEIGGFEDKALALFSKVEELEAEGKKLALVLAEAEGVFGRFQKSVESEMDLRKKAKAELQAKRKELTPAIKAEVFIKYERILGAREGIAMAAIEGNICQGCHIEVLPNDCVKILNGKELVTCRQCNRILYMPAENRA